MDYTAKATSGGRIIEPFTGRSTTHTIKPHSCCIPHLQERVAPEPTQKCTSHREKSFPESSPPVISIPSGAFLMGTDYARDFPADGEGPVRAVSLSAFETDAFPVTNADFAAFVAATGYLTEAEVIGWSFVFWSHIPEDRFDLLVEDTVAYTPWWCKVPDAIWKHPEGPGSEVTGRLTHPVVHVSWNASH